MRKHAVERWIVEEADSAKHHKNQDMLSLADVRGLTQQEAREKALCLRLVDSVENLNKPRRFTKFPGDSALIEQTRNANLEAVLLLLKAGADVEVRSRKGGTALYQCTMNDRSDLTKTLLHLEILRLLLDAGADVHTRCESGFFPLYLAAQHNQIEMAEELIHAQADVNARFFTGASPLYIAACDGHIEVCKLLIAAGAQVNARREEKVDDNCGFTPLMIASQTGQDLVVELLLDNDAEVNVGADNARGKFVVWPEGTTALAVASARGHEAIVHRLLKAGGILNAPPHPASDALPQPDSPLSENENPANPMSKAASSLIKLGLAGLTSRLPGKGPKRNGALGGKLAGKLGDNKYVAGVSRGNLCDDHRKSATATCPGHIEAGALCLGKIPPSLDGSRKATRWYHPACIFNAFRRVRGSTKTIRGAEDIEGFGSLSVMHQQEIQRLIDNHLQVGRFAGAQEKASQPKEKRERQNGDAQTLPPSLPPPLSSFPPSGDGRDPLTPSVPGALARRREEGEGEGGLRPTPPTAFKRVDREGGGNGGEKGGVAEGKSEKEGGGTGRGEREEGVARERRLEAEEVLAAEGCEEPAAKKLKL